jgi:arginyl-tRNA synthetase
MKQIIFKLLKKEVDLDFSEIESLIEIPPNQEMGDFAFPCFIFSKKLKKSPNKIAEDLKNKIKLPKEIEKVEIKGSYLNFFINKKIFVKKLVDEILEKKKNFGKKEIGKGKKIMIEFSQPNTHKAFHVGHIRGTSLGESLSRISEFFKEKVVRANYSGDTGMHIAKWIWCYEKFHSKEKLKDDESWIASIYVDAIKRLTKNEKFQEEVNQINKKIEDKSDKEINELWKKTRILSINSWKKIYNELNTNFNVHYFESEVEKKGKTIALQLLKKGIAKKSEGAVIIDLKKYKLGVWVLLRSDGTVLYSAKDLFLAEKKFKDYKLDKNFYVIANEQDLHMKQLFKTLELMKFQNVKKMYHISFNIVRLPTGKMSSRTGENILYSDFMKELIEYSKKRIKERRIKLSKQELEKRALVVSIAAIKYSMLKQGANKIIIFKKEDALNFEGDTGPYLLYSYARASSIIRKSKIKSENFKIKNLESKEFELTKKLSQFPEVIANSYKNYNPALIANYSYELAKLFNEFYHLCPVINSENEIFRLKIVKSFRIILKNSLHILGIETLEEM